MLNKSFQLKMIVGAALISLVTFACIIVFIISITGMERTDTMASAIKDLDRSVAVEDDIVKSFAEYSKLVKHPIFSLATEKIIEDHKRSIDSIKKNMGVVKLYAHRHQQLLVLIIVMALLNIALMTILIIHTTNKLFGPLRVVARSVKELLMGRKLNGRDRLRKGDGLHDLYEDFNLLIEKYERKRAKESARKKERVS